MVEAPAFQINSLGREAIQTIENPFAKKQTLIADPEFGFITDFSSMGELLSLTLAVKPKVKIPIEIEKMPKEVSDFERVRQILEQNKDFFSASWGQVQARASELQAACFAHGEGVSSQSSMFSSISSLTFVGFGKNEHKEESHKHCECGNDLEVGQGKCKKCRQK